MPETRVLTIYTGGTFGMAPDLHTPGNPLRPISLEELEQMLPDHSLLLGEISVDWTRLDTLLDSSSMSPRDWVSIAKEIELNYDKYDGFIVIQGTDTLAYTASALSFMLENLDKPVVVTGSQLPLGNTRTDATTNFYNSVMVAAHKAADIPKIPEVVVVFADKILRGCRVRKLSASSLAGFDSPNCLPLGEIGEHIVIHENHVRPSQGAGRLQVNTALNENVLDVSLYPGLRADHLSAIFNLPNVDGVVFRTFGTGNAPESPEFLDALRTGIQANEKVVVNVTQCSQGTVEMGLYAASLGLIDCGVISGLDMTPEAALTKLMVTLASQVGDQVKLQMQINQRGEQSMSLFDYGVQGPKRMVSGGWSDVISIDRRFDPNRIAHAVLRISGLVMGATGSATNVGTLRVFLNFPSATPNDVKHPRCILQVDLRHGETCDIVETLNKVQLRELIGDGSVTLTLVQPEGVEINFSEVRLNLFTNS